MSKNIKKIYKQILNVEKYYKMRVWLIYQKIKHISNRISFVRINSIKSIITGAFRVRVVVIFLRMYHLTN